MLKHLIVIILIVFCSEAFSQVPPQREEEGELVSPDYPVMDIGIESDTYHSDRVGYYNENGKYGFAPPDLPRQPAVYDQILFALNGFIVVKDRKFGIADRTGKVVGQIEYDNISILDPGYTFVAKKNNRFGTLSDSGTIILPLKYDRVLFCSNKLPVSFVEENGIIMLVENSSGKVLQQNIESAVMHKNLTVIQVNGKYSLVSDHVLLPFEYDSIFHPVYRDSYRSNMYQSSYKPPLFNFSDWEFPVNCLALLKDGKFGMVDFKGTVIYQPENDGVINTAIGGYYTVKRGSLYGIYFVESSKSTAIEFEKVYNDGIGYIMAVKDNRAGVFKVNGTQITQFEYDNEFIAQYTGIGLRVSKNGKRGIIDPDGKVLIQPVYDDVNTFFEHQLRNLIKVKSGSDVGVVNLNGDTVVPIIYDWLEGYNNCIKVASHGPDVKFGLLGLDGKVIVPVEYRSISTSVSDKKKITILEKDKHRYRFLDKANRFILPDFVSGYGYVKDHENLVNPFTENGKLFIYVTGLSGKAGILDELNGRLAVPLMYDEIVQRFESLNHTYFCVRKGNKFGLINELNAILLPVSFDAISLDLIQMNSNDKKDEMYLVVAMRNGKWGAVNLKNQVKIPFVYNDLQRISTSGLFKARTGKSYVILNSKNSCIQKGPFDQVANFEPFGDFDQNEYRARLQALTFNNGKMRVIDESGRFLTEEIPMKPHVGFKSFDELKQALIRALESNDNQLLKEFVNKVAPSDQLMYYLKNSTLNRNDDLNDLDMNFIREKYLRDLLIFRLNYWNKNDNPFGCNKEQLTDEPEYTFRQSEGYITNRKNSFNTYNNRFMKKFLLNCIKVNGFWISTYFTNENFNEYQP